jgi:hypothetical protein
VQQLSITAACIYFAFTTTAVCQDVEIVRPSFIESVAFFMTGKEPPAVIILSDTAVRVSDQPTDFQQSKEDPCLVFEKQTVPPYGLKYWNFAYFPGPSSAKISTDGVAIFDLPFGTRPVVFQQQAACSAKRNLSPDGSGKVDVDLGSIMCATRMMFGGPEVGRRLAALRYIRDNFCAGLPEPPITIKPY